jgi:hypothetical protein
MASISVDYSLGDPSQELVNHDRLVILWNRIKSLLDNMASEWIHGKAESVATDRLSDLDDLLGGAMLKASLN